MYSGRWNNGATKAIHVHVETDFPQNPAELEGRILKVGGSMGGGSFFTIIGFTREHRKGYGSKQPVRLLLTNASGESFREWWGDIMKYLKEGSAVFVSQEELCNATRDAHCQAPPEGC